jgi:Domain of unknown function (DUF4032)
MHQVTPINHRLILLQAPAVSARAAAVPYEQYLQEREQILKHKWILSEKAGRDIGFEAALVDWIASYRKEWLCEHQARNNERHDERERDEMDRTASPESIAA